MITRYAPLGGIVPGNRLPEARQSELMTLHRAFGTALLGQDLAWMEANLAEDAVFESQDVLTAIVGRSAVLGHLARKFELVARSGRHPDLHIGTVDTPRAAAHPCLLARQGIHRFLFLLTATSAGIDRIDVITVLPHPATARPLERLG